MVLGFDFPLGFRDEPGIRGIDMTRFQRASEGARESAGGGRDNVIESGGVGFEDLGWDLIMLGDGAVDAECHRRRFGRQIGAAHRALDAFDPDVRAVDDLRH
jgi:hypothetical protein